MRILLVNKFIFPKGGAETYTFDVGKMLEEHGHEVQYFGLENEKNIVGNRIGSYVTNMDFSQGIKANLNAPFRIIYSREARKKIRAVLDDFQPDVVHLNNIQYHLTPSIILEINKWRKETKKECKIVYTTHDYQLVCPSHGMFDVNMKPCERCLDGHYIHCLQTKCLKNSRAKSLLGTLDGYMWKYSKAYSYVDAYICCSFFLKSKLDTQKRFRDKTIGLHNFKKEMPHLDNIQKKGYVLEFGHLSRDKGTDTLLEVAKKMPNTEFVFIGYGPSVDKMKDIPNVKYSQLIADTVRLLRGDLARIEGLSYLIAQHIIFFLLFPARHTIPPMGVGVKKRATPSTARITEAIVSRTAQISNRNTSRAARRDNAKAKGATNIFSSIFIFKTSFIYPSYLYFIMPARGHKCCERLVNPVPKLRVILARSGKKRAGRQAPQRKPAALVLLCHQLGKLPQYL